VKALVLLVPLVLSAPTVARAQRVQPVIARSTSAPLVAATYLEVRAPGRGQTALRFGSALAGSVAGAVAGAALGEAYATRGCEGFCGHDGDAVDVGTAIGFIPGAALGASLPKLGSQCGFRRRFGHALLGSAVGVGVGGLVGAQLGAGTGLWTGLALSTIGSSVAVHGCQLASERR
jgi:hypothetical protein